MLQEWPLTTESAPGEWAEPCSSSEIRLHQLAPYIGKLKSSIAGSLIEAFTAPGETVLDPFCGSGTISLECILRGRNALAFDVNPYAVLLTRAKLQPPLSLDAALEKLEMRLQASRSRAPFPYENIPDWIRRFFHPATLCKALMFADECIEKDDAFLLACLLGILHHQRPGFLSYPSSHLVPYLRERKFPRSEYPELYAERAIEPRLRAKVMRALRTPVCPKTIGSGSVQRKDIADLDLGSTSAVDAIITSPPYMNALDYVRDNRLRMWFLDRSTSDYSQELTDKRAEFVSLSEAFIVNALRRLRRGGRCVLVIGETVRRKRMTSHPAEQMLACIRRLSPEMVLDRVIADVIPDVRRTRRESAATKKELILVLRKSAEPSLRSCRGGDVSSNPKEARLPLAARKP